MTSYPVGEVSQVSLLEVLRRVNRSIDFRRQQFADKMDPYTYTTLDELWQTWLRTKTRDIGFWPLVDRIMTEGFKVPVMIVEDEFGWTMGNGHHRIVAALWLCLDEIPVYFAEDANEWPRITDPLDSKLDIYGDKQLELMEERALMHKMIWS